MNAQPQKTRGEMLLEAIEEDVDHRLNPNDDDCPECDGGGYVSSCFEEFACIDPESGCEDCTRRCYECARAKRDRLKTVREEVIKSGDIEIAKAWLKSVGRWSDDLSEQQIKANLTVAANSLSTNPARPINSDS